MNNEKQVGIVKWFGDHSKDANYGFIQHIQYGDLFFHERSIKADQRIDTFKENSPVVFFIQESRKHRGKFEANHVMLLAHEEDLFFLSLAFTSFFMSNDKTNINKVVTEALYERVNVLFDSKHRTVAMGVFEVYYECLKKLLTDELLEKNRIALLLAFFKRNFSDRYISLLAEVRKSLSQATIFDFWLLGLINECPIDFIAEILLSSDSKMHGKIFAKCSDEEGRNIFYKILYDIDNIDTEEKLEIAKTLLNVSEANCPSIYEVVKSRIIDKCPDYFKLSLWLEEYHDSLDFDSYKLYTNFLSPKEQKRFVKKVVKAIHEGALQLSVEEFLSISVMDIDTSKQIEAHSSYKIDYSTSIVLRIVSELNTQAQTLLTNGPKGILHNIYDIVLKQIQDPLDILRITGFFDECGGRCNISLKEEFDQEGQVTNREVIYRRNENDKAKNHPICDGRKAVASDSGKPVLSKEGVEFWWCANQKCFKPSRQLHKPSEWESYSLLDFLTIFKVEFQESDLEIYLNVINKANRFLSHMKCRTCNQILYPKGKSNYAFYGVTNFHCLNENCQQKGREIYLSHCLNGFCDMEIDSRDCVKCRPKGKTSESCGWYICNHCHSCCTTSVLEKRKWVYDNILRRDYPCHITGHRDLGVIACNNCGQEMESAEKNEEEYQKVLQWFISNSSQSNRIHKFGKNSLGKWWFVLARNEEEIEVFKKRLRKLQSLGFRIPDYAIQKDLQLVCEPTDYKRQAANVLLCEGCGKTVDLNIDFEKGRAIKKFHRIRFPSDTS